MIEMSMKKPAGLILAFALIAAAGAGAQQITRIAVVDLQKIIMSFPQEGQSYKDFELKKAQIQAEIDRFVDEVKKLQAQKVEADKVGDKASSQRLQAEITQKTDFLKDYVRTKQAELDADAKQLSAASDFSQRVYKQIQQIAEAEGYSLVLNLKSADSVMSSVLWYSTQIDITDEVIRALAPPAPAAATP
jgi:outer membrane protein